MTKIGIVFGGPSPEHDISILTGLQACRLTSESHETFAIYWSRTDDWYQVPTSLEGEAFVEGVPQGAKPLALTIPGGFVERRRMRDIPLELDVVLNCCHGGPGEDGSLTAMLMLAGMRVSGPTPEAAAWSMDKLASAGIVSACRLDSFGIESIPTAAVSAEDPDPGFAGPWVVKGRWGGSSLGIELGVADIDTIAALCRTADRRAGAIAQPQLEGWADLNIAVRTHPGLEVSAIERPITSGAYGYREKYLVGADGMESAKRQLPADIPAEVADRVTQAARAIATKIGFSGLPRIDFLWDGSERLALCEINAIPGSLGLYLWAASGHDRSAIVAAVVEEALASSLARSHWSSNTDRAALRSAGTVASKLR